MKKQILLLLTCMFALGAWLSPLHADTGPAKKKLGASIVWEPLIGDPSQLNSNSIATDDAGSNALGNLIDGDKGSIFHSIWHTDMQNPAITEEEWITTLSTISKNGGEVGINSDPGYHNLQVMLEAPVSSFKFEFFGRNSDWHDNPTEIEIYATNDPELGASVKSAESSQWTKITELNQANANLPGDVTVQDLPYESPVIELGAEYSYIRFVVKNTALANKKADGTRNFKNPDVTGITFNLSEFQMYAPVEIDDPGQELQALVDSITKVLPMYDFKYGDNPGYVDSVKYKAMYALYEDASNALFDGSSDSELAKYCDDLRATFADFMATGVYQVETGYYNIINEYSGFFSTQKVTKSMNVNPQRKLGWATTDSLAASQLWKITKLDNGKYSIQNVASQEYIDFVAGQSKNVAMTATHQTDQLFDWNIATAGSFHIANVKNSLAYHSEGHSSGAGISGLIVTWEGGAGSCSAWQLRKVTDQELIDRLIANGPGSLNVDAMKLALDSAETSRAKVYEYEALITKATQIKSNAQSGGDDSPGDGSSYANLIDGNTGSIFHSQWLDAYASPAQSGTGWHNLQITLNEPKSSIKFTYTGRNDGSGWHDNPNHITIYATNDDALGASTEAADSLQWTQILDMTDKEFNFPGNVSMPTYNSPDIDLGGEYKYLRFVVKHTTTMDGGNRANSFASPSVTGVTFNLSEFQVYDSTPTAKSQYYNVPGMKEACDALSAAIEAANAKVATGNITVADIEALQTAYRLVDTLYINRDVVFNTLTNLLESANDYHNKAIGARLALISSTDQVNTNSLQTSQGSLAGLIDGDKGTVFHSIWDTSMADEELTEEQWRETVLANYSPSVGTGYHNLNVALTTPVKSFFFEYFSRNSDWHDNPSDIEIYATNDENLYADPQARTTSSWTLITEITEGFPTEATQEIPYTSPQIDLDGEYKYIRFVIKNTCLANKKADGTRDFAHPEITGITWNVSEFQMYTGLDPESVQYNYIEEVRVAADNLEKLIEKYSPYTKSDIISYDPVKELEAAIKTLQEAYVDTTDVVKLYNTWKDANSRSETGDEIGYVESQSDIDALDEALEEARALISPTQSTKEQVNTATEKMNAAIAEFMSHVKKIEPYVWYTIKSGSTREYAADQPVLLHSTSLGDKLHIGGYTSEPYADVYAIWRFVPIEGEEGQYAIQSLGTGQYWGAYRGQGTANGPIMSHEQTPYQLYYYGMGCFKLQQVGVADDLDCIKADGTDLVLCNYPANGDHQQAWKFEPVTDNTDIVNINWYAANSTAIMTLPWAVNEETFYGLNDALETYAVNSVTTLPGDGEAEGETVLTLTSKKEFAAGEPFVLVTLAEPDENGQQPLAFMLPEETAEAITDTSAVVNNGLIGTLQGTTINNMGSLYFLNSILSVGGDFDYSIPGRQGYIDVTKVTDLQGSIDKTISINGKINGVPTIKVVEDANEVVNVYTLDGVLIKRNVKMSEATKNLAKGIYIVGKKKILVK